MHLPDSDCSSGASKPLLPSIQSSVPLIALTLPGKSFHLSNQDSSEVSGWQESQLGPCILVSHRISPAVTIIILGVPVRKRWAVG